MHPVIPRREVDAFTPPAARVLPLALRLLPDYAAIADVTERLFGRAVTASDISDEVAGASRVVEYSTRDGLIALWVGGRAVSGVHAKGVQSLLGLFCRPRPERLSTEEIRERLKNPGFNVSREAGTLRAALGKSRAGAKEWFVRGRSIGWDDGVVVRPRTPSASSS
jgi:hypothetical protein